MCDAPIVTHLANMSRSTDNTSRTSGYSAVHTTELQSPGNADGADFPDAELAEETRTLSVVVPQHAMLIALPHNDPQTTGCYPGFAFCKFLPGRIETIIRVSLMVRHLG